MDSTQTTDSAADTAAAPTGTRCPSIDAEAIFAVASGNLSLHRAQSVASEPHVAAEASESQPADDGATGTRQPKQPHRSSFTAADIYELSRHAHPWQAETITKAG